MNPSASKEQSLDMDDFDLLAKQTEEIKLELDIMLQEKKISDEEYSKEIVLLAFEYAYNGKADEALKMLTWVAPHYFAQHSFEHFKEDESYFIKANAIYEILSYAGLVAFDVLATQKPASA